MNMLRKECIANMVARWESCEDEGYALFCGSKGEGIAKAFESDLDSLIIRRDILCTDNVMEYVNSAAKCVFYMDMEQTSAGYTLLRMEKYNVCRFVKILLICQVVCLFPQRAGN